ncbi:hypothetical protein [Tenacibaculum xiamenense]
MRLISIEPSSLTSNFLKTMAEFETKGISELNSGISTAIWSMKVFIVYF